MLAHFKVLSIYHIHLSLHSIFTFSHGPPKLNFILPMISSHVPHYTNSKTLFLPIKPFGHPPLPSLREIKDLHKFSAWSPPRRLTAPRLFLLFYRIRRRSFASLRLSFSQSGFINSTWIKHQPTKRQIIRSSRHSENKHD
jgi:hypothetical protein